MTQTNAANCFDPPQFLTFPVTQGGLIADT